MTRLSELVSALTPSEFAELALVLFLLVFAAIAIRESTRSRLREHATFASMPLADDDSTGDVSCPRDR